MADNVNEIIATARLVAREIEGETAYPLIEIHDDAEVRQEQSGCYVAAWLWVANVYVEED